MDHEYAFMRDSVTLALLQPEDAKGKRGWYWEAGKSCGGLARQNAQAVIDCVPLVCGIREVVWRNMHGQDSDNSLKVSDNRSSLFSPNSSGIDDRLGW